MKMDTPDNEDIKLSDHVLGKNKGEGHYLSSRFF